MIAPFNTRLRIRCAASTVGIAWRRCIALRLGIRCIGALGRSRATSFSVILIGAVAPADCHPQALPVDSPSEWTAPVDLPGMPANGLHRWPVMVTVHDTIYLAANVNPIYRGAHPTTVGARPIYLARIPGGPFSAPPGDFQFVYPKVLAAPNGDVHLLWAEFDSAQHDVLNWGSGRKTALWHSVLAHGAWSVPQMVFKGEWLEWPESGGNVAVDSAGVVHVVLFSSGGPNSGIMHFVRSRTGWRANHTPYTSLQTAVHPLGDSVLVAFVGDSYSPSDTTGVTVAISPDRGATWASSVVVDRLGGRFASSLQFIRSSKDLYLAWGESPQRQWRDTLRIVRLDAALRPTPVAAVPLPAGASTVAITEACGNLAFVVETFSQLPRTFFGTVTASGAVSQHSLLPPGEIAASSGIGATSSSVVVVVAIRPTPGTPGARCSCRAAHARPRATLKPGTVEPWQFCRHGPFQQLVPQSISSRSLRPTPCPALHDRHRPE